MSWDRIRGHAAARQTFQTAYARGRLGQGYLLVGPEGVGKQLFARELARALLCERPPAPLTACDSCPACAQVEAGTHPDLLTLRTPEEKHELPVDEMREFCAQLSRTPARGGRKVGIVVDADDFNQESANSFLKTLEEPPPGAFLLLIATGTARQLPTILSRCQIVRFGPLSPTDLTAVLAEQGVADPALRERLVRLAGGSVTRALAVNDEAIWTVREELIAGITSEHPDFLQLVETWSEFVDLNSKDTAAQRLRASVVIGFMLDVVRQAWRLALGIAPATHDPAEETRLREFAGRLGPDRLQELLEKCIEADYRIDRRVQLILVIESVLDQFTRG